MTENTKQPPHSIPTVTVSVIIPTCNRSDMLNRAIKSVLKQTCQDFEVIIVSDGCTDNTEEMTSAFNDLRISFIKHEQSRGASAARNTAIKTDRGDYLAFLDDANTSDAPTVSVLIATFNRAEMLKRAIASILAQTYTDYEIIIVSDGSNDNTSEIVESFHDCRVHLIQHSENLGYAAARNTGLINCRGKFIAFLVKFL